MLTQERLKEVLHYDPETGVFTRVYSQYRPDLVGKVAGSMNSDGYYNIQIGRKTYSSSRLALLYMDGTFPQEEIDHINGDRSDDSYKNLRSVSKTENLRNRKTPTNNYSGIIGVCFDSCKGEWLAQISNLGVRHRVYRGPDFFEACCARKSAELKYGYHQNHGR